MKRFKDYIREQHMAKGETTLDPEYTEKKEKKDKQIEKIIMKPTREAEKEAKKAETIDIAMEG